MENVLVDRTSVRLRRPARLLRLASDERLVALVRAGDEGAFEALYDRHHPAILGFCRHMLGTREEAEDAVQHTFLAAFRDLVRDDKPIELRPWLFAIARNRCVSLLRARRPQVAIELAEPATDGLAATVERREDLRELLADLAHLPEDQRAALLLAELGALDHAGIARVLGCPREKVKALVFQARTALAASREARATPCDQIRLELATASGAALRRGPLRRHLRACDGCRAFKAEVAMQRKLLALALPVVPSIALKASVLSSGGGGASASGGGVAAATSATTVGATSTASSGTVGSVLGTIASAGAGKVAVSLAVAGAVAGGGALTAGLRHHAATPPTAPSVSQPALTGGPGGAAAPFGLGGSVRHDTVGASDPASLPGSDGSPSTGVRAPAGMDAPPPAHAHDGGSAPGTLPVPSHTHPAHPAQPAPPEVGGGATPPRPAPTPPPPAQGEVPDNPPPPPPAHGRAPPAPEDPPVSPPATPPSDGRPAEPGASNARGSATAASPAGSQLSRPAPPASSSAPPITPAPPVTTPAAAPSPPPSAGQAGASQSRGR
jgi:RNA polymerase sigma factor (sigma-70 family)